MSLVGRLLLILLLVGSTPAFAQTNTWTEHPNTNFSTWARSSGVEAEHVLCQPSSSVGAILGAWVAGAYHEGTQRFLVYRGGGHADGCWNGGAFFDPQSKAWGRLTTASPNAPKMNSTNPDDSNFLVKYPDGTPSSVHSYGTQFCIVGGPLDGKCPTSGGIFWSRAGKSTPETPFIYDPTQPTAATAYTEKKLRPGGYGTIMAWNKTRQRAFMAGSSGAYEWDPVADVYTQFFTTSGAGTGTNIALDEAAGRVYVLMGGTPVGSRLKYVDYATAPTTKYQTITTTGGDGLENLAAPGFIFAGRDASNRVRLVGLGRALVTIPPVPPSTTPVNGNRAAIFTLLDDNVCGRGAAAPCVWTRLTPSNATSNLPPPPFTNGMWNKFFAHRCDLYAIVTAGSQSAAQLPPSGDKGNVWSFRPDFSLPGCAPATVTLTLTANGSTGSGTLSGAGTYTLGTTATIGAAPATGSSVGPVTGDQGCQVGPITMNANKACNIPFLDVLAPVVSISVPTPGQLVKTKTPVEFTVTDNMPGGVTTVLLDGQLLPNNLIDPATLVEGVHQIVVQAVDVAGNSSQATVSFVSVNCPPCRVSLTIQQGGTGTGTVSGAGEYLVGAQVEIGVNPTPDSELAGIAPPPCDLHFRMPDQNLLCLVTINKRPIPPPSGPIAGLVARTWKPFPFGTVMGQSKHARMFFDSKRKRMTVAGGDGTDKSGNSYTGQNVFAIDLAVTDIWTRLHGPCPPTGAPPVMPYKSDNVTWVYDSKRDRGVMTPAYYENPGTALACNNTYTPDTAKSPYFFDLVSNLWLHAPLSPPGGGWGGDLHDHWGVYDPITDAVYRATNIGNCGVQIIPLDGSTGACVVLSFPNAPPGSWDPANDMSTIDVQGRMMYWIARYKRMLVKWSIDERKVAELIPMPTTWVRPTSEFSGGDYETHVAFDSKNRVLFIPNDVSYGCGGATASCAATSQGTLIDATTVPNPVNRGVYFFAVDTKQWEWEAAPAAMKVSGNVLGYDVANNVFLYFGRSPTNQMWLYRYKD